jgi:hypothetical protein
MAAFIAMTSWQGEFTDDYFAQPAPDPAAVRHAGRGRRPPRRPAAVRPLLGGQRLPARRRALNAAPTRIVIAVGEESAGTYTARTAVGTAELLGQEATVFPSHHGGFLGGEFGYAGKPEEFAARLREVAVPAGMANLIPLCADHGARVGQR